MTDSDGDYYRRRAEQERSAALALGEGAAALIHLQLAEAYDGLAAISEPLLSEGTRYFATSPGLLT